MNKYKIINIIVLFLFTIFLAGCNNKATNTPDKYIVTFDSNGCSVLEKIKVKTVNLIKKNPTKEVYNFKEWQLNGSTYDFDAKKLDI